MSVVETRIRAYRSFVALPWAQRLSGAERVWIVIYPPHDERRLRKRVGEFELAGAAAERAELAMTPPAATFNEMESLYAAAWTGGET